MVGAKSKAVVPGLPRRPLLELLLRARDGLAAYSAVPLGGGSATEIRPAREARSWLWQCVLGNPLMQEYLKGIPSQSRQYVVNRVLDGATDMLYASLEPWRVGSRWAKFEGHAFRMVGMACWVCTELDDDPCDPTWVDSGAT